MKPQGYLRLYDSLAKIREQMVSANHDKLNELRKQVYSLRGRYPKNELSEDFIETTENIIQEIYDRMH